jgi:uncharacterized protein YyaL (SSP411 family)
VAIVGDPADPATAALLTVVRGRFRPGVVVALASAAASGSSAVPLLHDRPQLDWRATAYVCRGFACQKPTTSPEELGNQLTESRYVRDIRA